MNDNARATAGPDARLDHFAAELARAAYHVALRHEPAGTWLDLELDLWHALAATVNRWRRELPPGAPNLSLEVLP